MSQAGIINASAVPEPPNVLTTVQTPNGDATPVANTLLIDAFDDQKNFDNGITVRGGANAGDPPDGGNGAVNEVSIYLTNRKTSQTTTPNATLTTILALDLSLSPAAYATYTIWGNIQALDTVSAIKNGGSYNFSGGFLIDSAGVITELGTEYSQLFETPGFATIDFTLSASGSTVIVQVQGLATPVNWNCLLEFRRVV